MMMKTKLPTVEKVTTSEQLERFNKLWLENWTKNFKEDQPFKGKAHRYIVKSPKGVDAGSVEINDYNPVLKTLDTLRESSNVEDLFAFSQLEEVKQNQGRIIEIDKVSILKEFQNTEVLLNILAVIVSHFKHQNVKYAATLMDPKFFRKITRLKIFSRKVGEVDSGQIDYEIYPVLIEAEKIMKNIEMYPYIDQDIVNYAFLQNE
jgi:hypothetical protein